MGVEVQRLHEETEQNDGENPLRRWPTTKGKYERMHFSLGSLLYHCLNFLIVVYQLKPFFVFKGYIYKPDGLPMACDASAYAFDAFNSIVDEAERHHKGPYQKHLKRSQHRLITYNHTSSPSYISRLIRCFRYF